MKRVLRGMARAGYPLVTPLVRDLYRLRRLATFGASALLRGLRWYLKSREYTNFTYAISQRSRKYLASLLANVFHAPVERVISYFEELEGDQELADWLDRQVRSSPDRYFADLPIKYGRRIGWYALVRLLRPRVIVESGVDRGVGTCVLAAALLRNGLEAQAGKIFALDIDPLAGSFIGGPYGEPIQLVHGDSLAFLGALNERVDLFIHDSDHAATHERAEYELLMSHLSSSGVVVTDNAELTDSLFEFAQERGMVFWHWREEVLRHIYSGGGIGLATPPASQASSP